MADKIKLKVQKRKLTGRKVKQLRDKGIIPANIYGKDVKSLAIELPVKDFHAAFKVAGETNIIDLQIDKDAKARPVLVSDIHRHPVTDYYLHVDFHQVDLTKKATVNIPVEIIGEAPATTKGGLLFQLMDEIEVEALPMDLPDKFTLDISKLEEIGQGLSLKDIKIDPKKVNFTADNLDELVVKIEEPTKEDVEDTPIAEEEVEGEEGEAPEGEEGETKEGETKGEGKPEAKKEGDKPGAPKDGKEAAKPDDKKEAKK